MTAQDVAARFARETAEHQMTVLHDDGLYRHLHFQRTYWRPPMRWQQRSSFYWFDLITVPGTLIFQGDGESWTFRRIDDMFEFFRGERINPSYWAEKLTDGRARARRYDSDLFTAKVTEAFVDAARGDGVPPGTGAALRRDVLDSWDYSVQHEDSARQALADFEHNGFRFSDTWEWSFDDWDWWFLWSLHAIVWGISVYDRDGATPVEGEGTRAVETAAVAGGVL